MFNIWMFKSKFDVDEDCVNWCIMLRLVYLIFIERLFILLYELFFLKKDES